MDELREHEEAPARQALLQVLASSVAFHNADLSMEGLPPCKASDHRHSGVTFAAMRMRRPCALSLLLLFSGCGPLGGDDRGGSGDVSADCSAPATTAEQFECRLLQLVNEQRARGATCGGQVRPAVGPLRMHAVLRRVARVHAEDMARRNYFDHNTPEGQSPFDRMRAAGYSLSAAGENIAAGESAPEATMQQWMQSSGHCENIMRAAYVDFGAGYAYFGSNPYQHLWVQDFGTP